MFWNTCGVSWDPKTPSAAAPRSCQQVTKNEVDYTGQYTFSYFGSTAHTMPWLGPGPSVDDCLGELARLKVAPKPMATLPRVRDGYHFAPPLEVPGDNVERRLSVWLRFLAKKYPQQGWGQFLDGQSVRWSRVVVAGHSQGASLVPELFDLHPELYRGIMIGGPETYVFNSKSNTKQNNPTPPWGVHTPPTYVKAASAARQRLWGFYGEHDDNAGTIVATFGEDGMKLPAGTPAASFEQNADGDVAMDACVSGPGGSCDTCTAVDLAGLDGSGAHKLRSHCGGHVDVRGQHGAARPWVNRKAWDYLLVGKGGAGAACRSKDWCASGTGKSDHTCQ
jgi:hypothetical protein